MPAGSSGPAVSSTRASSSSHGGSKRSANSTERAWPSRSQGSVVRRSVSSSSHWRRATPSALTTRSAARPRRPRVPPRPLDRLGRVAPRLRQPVALVAQPGVVQHRGLVAAQPLTGHQGPVGVAPPLAQVVDRVPARQHRVGRAGRSPGGWPRTADPPPGAARPPATDRARSRRAARGWPGAWRRQTLDHGLVAGLPERPEGLRPSRAGRTPPRCPTG